MGLYFKMIRLSTPTCADGIDAGVRAVIPEPPTVAPPATKNINGHVHGSAGALQGTLPGSGFTKKPQQLGV